LATSDVEDELVEPSTQAPQDAYQAIEIMFEIAPQEKVDNQIARPFLLAVDVLRDTEFSPASGPPPSGCRFGAFSDPQAIASMIFPAGLDRRSLAIWGGPK
jgi:hypothetical protein